MNEHVGSSGKENFLEDNGVGPNILPDSCSSGHVRNNATGDVLHDASGNPITVEALLNTKPLRCDLSTRPGPGGRKLTYISGDAVTRTLNQAFGHDGWSLSILSVQQQHAINLNEKEKNKPPKWQVTYIAHIRITLTSNGSFREDYGMGDSIDKNLPNAIGHALKASITDGMKRSARLFGEKLGNSLYDSSFSMSKAPATLAQAIGDFQKTQHDVQRQFQPKPTNPPQKQQSQNQSQHQAQKHPNPRSQQQQQQQQQSNSRPPQQQPQQQQQPLQQRPAANHGSNNAPSSRPNSSSRGGYPTNGSSSSAQHHENKPLHPLPSTTVDRGNNMRPPQTNRSSLDAQRNDQTPLPRVSDPHSSNARPNETRQNTQNQHWSQKTTTCQQKPQQQQQVPRVSDVTPAPPPTAAQGLQSMFTPNDAAYDEGFNDVDASLWQNRPPTATGKRPPSSAVSQASHPPPHKAPRLSSSAMATNPYH